MNTEALKITGIFLLFIVLVVVVSLHWGAVLYHNFLMKQAETIKDDGIKNWVEGFLIGRKREFGL